jgi:competence protein ComEC
MNKTTPATGLRAVLIGILIGMTVGIFGFSFVTVGTLIGLLILGDYFSRTTKNVFKILLFVLLGFGLGLGILATSFLEPSEDSIAEIDGYQFIEATVVSVERTTEDQKLVLGEIEIGGEVHEDKMLLFIPAFDSLQYGDRIRFSCRLESPEPFDGFAYDQFLESRDIYKLCFLHESPLHISEGHGNTLLFTLAGIRSYFIHSSIEIFGEPHGTLLSGLLFGQELFTDNWDDRLQKTGTTHIVAASGYNVALVTWLLFGLLTWLGIKRQKAFWVLLAGIVLFVLIAGADAAVVRAGVMGGLILVARTIGRRASMVNVLLLTAILMLLVNPLILRYDVGFQLSMLSTIGLIYFTPWLSQKLKFIPEAYTLRESMGATLAATVATLPIIILQFNQIALLAPIANILILPLLPYTMFFGAMALLVGTLWINFAIVLSAPGWLLLSIVLGIIRFLSELSFVYAF